MARGKNSGVIKHDHAQAAEAALEDTSVKEVIREQRLEKLQLQEKMKNLATLRELLRTPIVISNFTIQEFRQEFRDQTDWCVSYFFPVVKDESGKTVPTYVDAPANAKKREICARKAEIMKQLGRRYIICEVNNQLTAESIHTLLSQDEEGGESMMKEGAIVSL